MEKVDPCDVVLLPITTEPVPGRAQVHHQEYHGNAPVPVGLQQLATLDSLTVKQDIEWAEILCGFETQNRYKILDAEGSFLYKAKEDTDCCTRNLCGNLRCFDMVVTDAEGQPFIHFNRPFRCGIGPLFGCCKMQCLSVFCPPGQLAGSVEEMWNGCKPRFAVRDPQEEIVFWVEGEDCGYCALTTCCTSGFSVHSPHGEHVGDIEKQWGGFGRCLFTDATNFSISFPTNLEVQKKALLLGALFLIDFLFFERNKGG